MSPFIIILSFFPSHIHMTLVSDASSSSCSRKDLNIKIIIKKIKAMIFNSIKKETWKNALNGNKHKVSVALKIIKSLSLALTACLPVMSQNKKCFIFCAFVLNSFIQNPLLINFVRDNQSLRILLSVSCKSIGLDQVLCKNFCSNSFYFFCKNNSLEFFISTIRVNSCIYMWVEKVINSAFLFHALFITAWIAFLL